MAKIHPREIKVRKAKLKLMKVLSTLREELTEGEFLKVMTEELSSTWSSLAKYQIREERHPGQPDYPGGLE